MLCMVVVCMVVVGMVAQGCPGCQEILHQQLHGVVQRKALLVVVVLVLGVPAVPHSLWGVHSGGGHNRPIASMGLNMARRASADHR